MRYIPELGAYAEPCPWCGVEVARLVYLRRRGALHRIVDLDGEPHDCPVPRALPVNERDIAPHSRTEPRTARLGPKPGLAKRTPQVRGRDIEL